MLKEKVILKCCTCAASITMLLFSRISIGVDAFVLSVQDHINTFVKGQSIKRLELNSRLFNNSVSRLKLVQYSLYHTGGSILHNSAGIFFYSNKILEVVVPIRKTHQNDENVYRRGKSSTAIAWLPICLFYI